MFRYWEYVPDEFFSYAFWGGEGRGREVWVEEKWVRIKELKTKPDKRKERDMRGEGGAGRGYMYP